MSFYGKTHTQETREKIRQSTIERYKKESSEKRAHRIQAHKDYYIRLRADIESGAEKELHQAHVKYIKGEYERLKDNGEI